MANRKTPLSAIPLTDAHLRALRSLTASVLDGDLGAVRPPPFERFLRLLQADPAPDVDNLSRMGSVYNDARPSFRSDEIVSAQRALIEACIERGVPPRAKWFQRYHTPPAPAGSQALPEGPGQALLTPALATWVSELPESKLQRDWSALLGKAPLAKMLQTPECVSLSERKDFSSLPTPAPTPRRARM